MTYNSGWMFEVLKEGMRLQYCNVEDDSFPFIPLFLTNVPVSKTGVNCG